MSEQVSRPLMMQRQPWAVLRCPQCASDSILSTQTSRTAGCVSWSDDVKVLCANPRCMLGYSGKWLDIGDELRLERVEGLEYFRFQVVA